MSTDMIQYVTDSGTKKMWLVGPSPTVVDIVLSILLGRLKLVGLSGQIFEYDRMPNVEKYYKNALEWDSFRKSNTKWDG